MHTSRPSSNFPWTIARRRIRPNFDDRKMTQSKSTIAEWGVATRPLPGESSSGDRHLVMDLSDRLLIAVVDGAGHGPEAAEAAELAIKCLASNVSSDTSLYNLINHCHKQLRGTRGGVMSLGLIQ